MRTLCNVKWQDDYERWTEKYVERVVVYFNIIPKICNEENHEYSRPG